MSKYEELRLRLNFNMEDPDQVKLYEWLKQYSSAYERNRALMLVRNRLKRNYSLNKALNSPKKIAKQGKPIVVNGILYNSIAEAARKLGLSHKEGTIRSRLRAGWSNNDAFNF